MALIEVRGIEQKLEGKTILRDIDLQLHRGEAFSIIGPTGAGKTSLLRVIGLLDRPSRGKVFVDGRDVTASGPLRLSARRKMAFVMQRPRLFRGDVFYNVVCGLKWRGLRGQAARRRCREVLELVGLAGYEKRDVRTLSGGEAQRVAIARALALEPEVLILDEPTSSLDPHSANGVEELICSLSKGKDMTVIVATHSMVQAQKLSDRIGVMLDGRMVQIGTPKEVFWTPESEEVALFVGVENLLEGVVEVQQRGIATVKVNGGVVCAVSPLAAGERVWVCLRPEDVALSLSPAESSARNRLKGRVVDLVPLGPFMKVEVDCGPRLKALITAVSAEEMGLKRGQEVFCSFKATAVHLMRRSSD